MPADVETMAYVMRDRRDVPWHGLGKAVPELMDDETALRESGLDWEVEKRPVFTVDEAGHSIEIPDVYATTRTTDNAVFGLVGKYFQVYQNREMLEFGSTFADTTGAKWDTVGSLRGGKQVWAMFRLDATDLVLPGGDEVWSWVLISQGHDGNSSLTASVVKERVVCTNTLKMALRGARSTYRIRHTNSMHGKVQEAREALEVSTRYDAVFEAEVERMLAIPLGYDKFDEMVDEVLFPGTERQREKGKMRADTVVNRASLKDWARETDTVDPAVLGTGWGKLQVVTEWAQWVKPLQGFKHIDRAEQEFTNVMSGPAAELEKKAHEAIMALA